MRLFQARYAPIAVGAAFFALYGVTLAPDVVGHDAGEFQFVPYIFGIPHITGYPLQLIVGKLWSLLPIGSVAYRMNLLSALCGGAAAALTYLCGIEIAESWAAGLAAALAVGLAPLEWTWSTIAGVRAPAVLFVAAALLAALRWERAVRSGYPKLAARRLLVLGLVLGLALDHHRTIVFLIPLLAAFVTTIQWPTAGTLARAAGCLLAPLALYGVLPLRAAFGAPWDQLNTATWTGFVNLTIAGSDASAHLDLGPAAVVARLPLLGQAMLQTFSPLGVALALGGLLWLAPKRPSVAVVLAGYAAILSFFTLEWHLGDALNLVYLMPAYVPIALLAGTGMALAARGRLTVQLVLLAGIAAGGLYVNRARFQPTPETLDDFRQELFQGHQARRLADAFGTLPPDATVVGNWDQASVFWYAQFVDHLNPGAAISYPATTLPDILASAPGPVYLATATERPPTGTVTAAGPFAQVLPRAAMAPPDGILPLGGDFGGEVQLAGMAPMSRPSFGVLAVSLYWKALRPPSADYHVSVRLTSSGRVVAQRDEAAPVLGLSPTSSWTPGQVTGDYYELDLRSLPDGIYDLAVVLYQPLPNGGFRNLTYAGADQAIAGRLALSAGGVSFTPVPTQPS